jgi:hypothetical protein
MLFFDGGLALVFFAVWVFCIIDVITTSESDCRNLPKMLWLLVVILLVDVGSIAWLVAGRNWNAVSSGLANRGSRPGGARGAPTRPARARATNPDDDEDFLAGLRARAEEQRRRAREAEPRDEPPAGNSPPT